jgi:hypothetical protein
MAYGLKYYFVDKKLVGSTSTTYTFEILEDGYSGSTTEWRGIDIQRQYEELSFRQVSNIQKSSCVGSVRVIDGTQRSALETIAGSEIGDYKVQLKKDGTVVWTGLIVPDLTIIGEENYGNQSAEIVAKDLFFTGDYPLTTLIPDTRGIEKAIVLIADILDTLDFGLDIVSYTSWIENNLTQSDDILNQSYHEKERFRIYGQTEGEDDRPLTNQQALLYILRSYGLILRQVNGAWNLIQVTAFDNPASVRRYVYNSSGTQTSSSTSYSLGSSAVSDELYVLGRSANNYFAGTKKVKSKFEHESIIQGIKFNREYWIDDATEIEKSQYWQADGTGNLELSFTTWFAKTTDTDLGNPVVMTVSIYVDTGGTDYYWNGTSWVTSPATIDIEVQETYSTTDSDGNYIYKNTGINIVTDAIPDPADGTLYVKLTPDALQPNYAYWYLRDLVFDLKYSDTVEGISSAIFYELEQTGGYSDEYDVGVYYFGDGPTSASLSALKNSSRALLSQWKRAGDASTTNHQNLILNEIMNVRRNQRRNIRATLYGEYEPDDVLSYDSTSFFFLGGSWSSRAYQWNCNFVELNIEEATDTLTAFYITDGSGTSSGAVGSSGGSTGTSSLYLEKGKNLSDVPTPATARTNLGLGSGDSPTFGGLTINGDVTISGTVDGRDVSDDGADLDELYTTIGLSALTSAEVDQLENIGSVTVSNTQWGYLGALDQPLTTTSDVQFDDITLTGIVKTNEIDAQADLIWDDTNNTEVWNLSDYYANNAVNIGSNVYITDELDVEEDVRIGNSLTVSGSAIISSNATIGGSLTLSGSADFNSTMNLQGNLTTQADLADDGFSEGWAGTNWKINADGSAEFEEMRIRGALRVYEFIAKQISTIGGSEILSIAQGRVVSAGSGEIEIENVTGTPGNSFKAGDLWICQVVDINNDLESGGTGSIVKSVRGLVDSVSGNDLTVTIESGSLSDLEQGDLIVGYGSTSDADRQAIMYRNVDRSEDNLIMRLQTGVNDFSKLQAEANTRVAFGDLNGYSGLSSETFGFFAGDNSNEHILVTDGGLFLKDGASTLAQLTSNTFKVGDGTNFLSFNGSSFDIQTDTFDLNTTNLDISSANENIVIGTSSYLVTLGKLNTNEQGLTISTPTVTNQNFWKLSTGDIRFKVGDGTNYLEYNETAGSFEIKVPTFTLDATDASGGIKVESANQRIQLEDADRVRTQVDINDGTFSLTETSEYNAGDATVINQGTAYISSAFQTTKGDSLYIDISAELTSLGADGSEAYIQVEALGSTSSGGSYTSFGSFLSSLATSVGNTVSVKFSAHSYSYDWVKIRITVFSDDTGFASQFELNQNIIVKSYDSQTRLSLDGLFVNSSNTQYARLTRSENELSGIIKMKNLPTSDPQVAGVIYNDGGTLKISAG